MPAFSWVTNKLLILRNELAGIFSLKGSSRSRGIKKNASVSLVIMLLTNLTSFLLVPIVLGYLDITKYGIWLTVNSILAWVFLLDLGLGGGLRTRMAQAIATNNIEDANVLINTCYAAMSLMMGVLLVLFYLIAPNINWVKVLNAPVSIAPELSRMMMVIVIFFLLRFVLQLINGMYTAIQRNAFTNVINFISQLFALSAILIFAKHLQGSLFWIGFIYSAAPLVVFVVFTILFFARYRQFKLHPKFVRFSSLKRVMGIGMFEFIDQIAFVILMSATNLIIAQISSPAEVVPYQVTMRIFGIFLTAYTLATNPLIPAFTEAYTLNDHQWIKNVFRKANIMFIICATGMVIFIPLSKPIFNFLVKGKTEISLSLVAIVVILTLFRMFSNVYTKFLTGCGKVRLLALSSGSGAMLYVTFISLFGVRLNIGVQGILLTQIIVGLLTVIVAVKQSRKVIFGTATGIWNR